MMIIIMYEQWLKQIDCNILAGYRWACCAMCYRIRTRLIDLFGCVYYKIRLHYVNIYSQVNGRVSFTPRMKHLFSTDSDYASGVLADLGSVGSPRRVSWDKNFVEIGPQFALYERKSELS
jgi:hypothetical protein